MVHHRAVPCCRPAARRLSRPAGCGGREPGGPARPGPGSARPGPARSPRCHGNGRPGPARRAVWRRPPLRQPRGGRMGPAPGPAPSAPAPTSPRSAAPLPLKTSQVLTPTEIAPPFHSDKCPYICVTWCVSRFFLSSNSCYATRFFHMFTSLVFILLQIAFYRKTLCCTLEACCVLLLCYVLIYLFSMTNANRIIQNNEKCKIISLNFLPCLPLLMACAILSFEVASLNHC